jgi:hypothetical protein
MTIYLVKQFIISWCWMISRCKKPTKEDAPIDSKMRRKKKKILRTILYCFFTTQEDLFLHFVYAQVGVRIHDLNGNVSEVIQFLLLVPRWTKALSTELILSNFDCKLSPISWASSSLISEFLILIKMNKRTFRKHDVHFNKETCTVMEINHIWICLISYPKWNARTVSIFFILLS